jgi:hypothetical protein
MIALGNAPIASMKLGTQDVSRVMLGTAEVWSSFSPLSLSPALWLSDTGSDPAIWPDISGNGRNATQGTVDYQPAIIAGGLNGRQVRRFNGSTSFMQHTAPTDDTTTIIAVYKLLSLQNGWRGVIGITSASVMLARLSGDTNWGSYTNGNVRANSPASLNAEIHSMVDNSGSGGQFFLNGAADGTWSGNTSGQTNHIGGVAGQLCHMDAAEILVFPELLSPADRLAVERWLGNKWGITVA